MTSWYILSVIALLLFGIQRFLYKVSAEANCSTAVTTFSFMGTVTCLSFFFFLLNPQKIDNISYLVFISLVNSASFFAGTYTTIEALKHLPASVAMPLIRLNTGLVVLFGVVLFGDRPSFFQCFGIMVALTVMVIIARSPSGEGGPQETTFRGFAFASAALFSGAAAAISSAYAALYVNKLAFMAISYFLGTLFSAGMHGRRGVSGNREATGKALLIGLGIGIVNFTGFYTLLLALARGPVSVIIPFTGLSFIVAVFLSVIVYGEKINTARGITLAMTILAAIMMRL